MCQYYGREGEERASRPGERVRRGREGWRERRRREREDWKKRWLENKDQRLSEKKVGRKEGKERVEKMG